MALGRAWRGPLAWFNPAERGIIPLEGFHIPRRLADRLRSRRFAITTDRAFQEVVLGCAAPRRDEPDTWINREIVDAYTELHRAGHAHSIEAWLPAAAAGEDDAPTSRAKLVGGIYGVHIGSAFFAESKFCRPDLGGTDASKVCLAHLMLHVHRRGFALLDTQYWNEHLDQFGCIEIPRSDYLKRLARALAIEAPWEPFDPELNLKHVL